MTSYKISFWNLPPSKDDSFIGLPQAELIHAEVNSIDENNTTHFVIEPVDAEWKEKLGTVKLARSRHHWQLINGNDFVQEIFPRIVEAITNAETTLQEH